MVERVGEDELDSWKFEAEYNGHQDLLQSHFCENEPLKTDSPLTINEESFQNITSSLNTYKDISENTLKHMRIDQSKECIFQVPTPHYLVSPYPTRNSDLTKFYTEKTF